MTLLQTIERDAEAEQVPARRRYAQLLCSGKEDAKTAGELRELMRALDKTPADLALDLELCRRASHLSRVIEKGNDLTPKIEAAEKAVADSFEDMKRVQAEMRARHHQLVFASQGLSERRSNADRAYNDLQELLRRNAELLGGMSCPEYRT